MDGSDNGLDPMTPAAIKPEPLFDSMPGARPEHNQPDNGAGGAAGTHEGHADCVGGNAY